MEKKIRCPSPDITETPLLNTRRSAKSKDKRIASTEVINTNEELYPLPIEDNDDIADKEDAPVAKGMGRGRGAKKRGVGRPRGRPRKVDTSKPVQQIEIKTEVQNTEEVISKIEKHVQGINLSRLDDSITDSQLPSSSLEESSIINNSKVNESQASSIFSVKEEIGYSSSFIPGLDLLGDQVVDSSSGINLSPGKSKTAVSKAAKEILASIDDQMQEDNDTTKIRRSSRIKSLEVQRGTRGRRREVVFSSSSINKSLVDDDSNSNSSTPPQYEPSEFSSSASGQNEGFLGTDDSNSNSPTKPLKVKSRWRFSSDAESLKSLSLDSIPSLCSLNDQSDSLLTNFVPSKDLVRKPGHLLYDEHDHELLDKLKKFHGIEESVFRKERKVSKESKGMVCDCFLTNEDFDRGEKGCVEDCLNRLLMVECGPRCPTGDRCMNKKFQRKQYATLEVFKTEKKGHGLRTLHPIPEGGFVIEYVGEVLDPYQFETRISDYAQSNQEHFYFMALKSDSIIDATVKGNCSRFINHSCEPNCETQKWTVNGELRIGFFTIRDLKPGEEIVFDYQFQRYGKKAQKCFCQTPSCRGWIGEVDEDEEEGEDDTEGQDTPVETEVINERVIEKKPRKVGRPRKPRKDTSHILEDIALEEELVQLERTGLKNKNHTLTLSRLMVRAEKWDDRERLLHILIKGDPACLRLFLDYRGLKLLYNWMISLPLPSNELSNQLIKNQEYHLLFLKALGSLSIPNKTLLLDSKILSLIEIWAAAPSSTTVPKIEPESVPLEEPPTLSPKIETVEVNPSDKVSNVDNENKVKIEHDQDPASVLDTFETITPKEEKMEIDEPSINDNVLLWSFVEIAITLKESWGDLKEVFRIPKKERVEQMKEHEREADKDSALSLGDNFPQNNFSSDRDGRSKWNGGRNGRERRISVHDSHVHRQQRIANMYPHLSKEERRSLFAARVAQEEEDMRQRRMQEEIVSLHQRRCALLGLDSATTPMVDISGHYYLDPKTIQWKTIVEADPHLPYGIRELVKKAKENNGLPIMGQPFAPLMFEVEPQPEYAFPPWPEGLPPPPPFPPAQLPDGWTMSIDDEGRCYYYHVRQRVSQWFPPSLEDVEAALVESSDSTDSEELENEDIPLEVLQTVTQTSSPTVRTKHTRLIERAERRKKSGLVQERIISPRTDEDKSHISKAVIRARKLEVMEEKRQKLAEELLKSENNLDESLDEPQFENSSNEELSSVGSNVPESSTSIEDALKMVSISLINNDDEDDIPCSPIETELDISLASIKDDNLDSFTMELAPVPIPEKVIIPGLGIDPRDRITPTSSTPPQVSKKDRLSKLEKKQKSLDYKKLSADKNKEKFRNQIANVVVTHLNPYRKPDCKSGRIVSTEDFKHLARKMTHAILLKELKHSREGKVLEVNDSVKHKTKEYIRKFMGRFGNSHYVPSPEDSQTSSA